MRQQLLNELAAEIFSIYCGAPMKLRQQRLEHAPGSDITMAVYTHLIGDDDHRVAAQLGEILCPDVLKFNLVKMHTQGTQ